MFNYLQKSAIAFIFLCLCLVSEGISANTASDSTRRIDFWLSLRDGVKLDCSKFYPKSNDTRPKNGWPVIVFCHGYGDNKQTELEFAEARARYGYCTYAFSMRGQGKSGGVSNLISRIEMKDLFDLIQYVKADSIGQDADNIALFGGSQGGILPFMAACHGLKVRTIMSDLASAQFASNWIENGCIKSTLYYALDYDPATVRYGERVKNIRKYVLSSSPDKWDSLYAEMPKDRDFIEKVGECKIPMLFTNAWQDEFFNTKGCFNIMKSLKTPYNMYFGAVDGHGSDWSVGENDFLSNRQSDWIVYWLLNRKNGMLDSARFTFASSHFPVVDSKWSYSHFKSQTWPIEDLKPVKFYFNVNKKIDVQTCLSQQGSLAIDNKVKKKISMSDFISTQYEGKEFNNAFEKSTVMLESEALTDNYQSIGLPKAKLYYSSNANVCQFNIQIWEVTPNGEEFLVTRINYTDRHYKPNKKKSIEVEGQANSHIFNKGNKIKIVLTNFDTQYMTDFPSNCPFVLPVLENSVNKIYVGAKQASYIELPMRIFDAKK